MCIPRNIRAADCKQMPSKEPAKQTNKNASHRGIIFIVICKLKKHYWIQDFSRSLIFLLKLHVITYHKEHIIFYIYEMCLTMEVYSWRNTLPKFLGNTDLNVGRLKEMMYIKCPLQCLSESSCSLEGSSSHCDSNGGTVTVITEQGSHRFYDVWLTPETHIKYFWKQKRRKGN